MAWEVEDIEATVERLRARGVVFEEYDLPGLRTVNGIAEVTGNYPSKGRRWREGRLVQGQRGQSPWNRPTDKLTRTMPGPDRRRSTEVECDVRGEQANHSVKVSGCLT